MPQVPISDGNRVRLQPLPDTQQQATEQGGIGEAIGQGAATLGQSVERFAVVQAERLQQVDRTALAAQSFDVQQRLSERIQGLRDNAAAGAAGHVAAVHQAVQEETQPFIASIGDPVLRNEFQQRVAAIGSSAIIDESVWADHTRIAALTRTSDDARDRGVNGIMTNPTPQNFTLTRDTLHAAVDGLTAVPESMRQEMRDKIDQETAAAYVVGEGRDNPGAALATLRGGTMDDWLSPEQRRSLETTMSTAQRQRSSAARSAAQSQIDVFQGRLRNHDQTITDADIAQMGQLAASAGIPTEAFNLATARVMHQADTEFRNSTPIEIRNAIGALNTQIGQAGDHASPDDVVRRNHLQTLLTQRESEMEHDPGALVERRGVAIPPLDGTPASIHARVAAMLTVERQTGALQFFRPQEVQLLRNQMASGPRGELAVLHQVAPIGNYDTRMALAAAEQIAPGSAAFRMAMRLGTNGSVQVQVLEGAAARHLLPRQMTDPEGNPSNFDALTQAWFVAHAVPSLAMSRPEFINEVLEGARNIYAERARREGRNTDPEFSPAQMSIAVSLALGQTSRGGGLASWAHGPRAADGNPQGFLLPTGMSQAQFEQRMFNLPYGSAAWPAGSANGTPTVDAAQLRAGFVPVAVSDGVYMFRNGNQLVMTRQGAPFRLDIRRVTPAAVVAPWTGPTPLARYNDPDPIRHPQNAHPVWIASPDTTPRSPDPTLSPAQYRALHPSR